MKSENFIRSLMMFNERVLHNGSNINKVYNIEDLNSQLFFNKVFIGNANEIFQKYYYFDIVDNYLDDLDIYINNIKNIISTLSILNPSVIYTKEDSFERRLATSTLVEDCIITDFFPSLNYVKYNFIESIIYYISILSNGCVSISYIDPRQFIYKDGVHSKIGNIEYHWKTDDCIISYLNECYGIDNTVAIKVTVSTKNDSITKVECNSNDIDNVKRLIPLFPNDALVIMNPYMYISDLERTVKSVMGVKVEFEQNYSSISFDDIFINDYMIEYPNDSFNTYTNLLSDASTDPKVESIYISLYRIGSDPSIYNILRNAVNNHKRVIVNIELMASGEKINMLWKREMEKIGIEVHTYACGKLKVHSKLTLICFKNGNMISQIGTGNYQSQTTSQYTDLNLITSDKTICENVLKVFRVLSEDVGEISFSRDLLVTKYNARSELKRLIRKEASREDNGFICIKCNALDDEQIIEQLIYAASMRCRIILIIRGVCTWVPAAQYPNVTIKSVIWDKLEHSRVYCFGSEEPSVYLGSLDLVTNKLDERIETLVKVKNTNIILYVCHYLNKYITNTNNSWVMLPDGNYLKGEE